MYKLGALACLFVAVLVGACGCSGTSPGANQTPGSTPTLPANYVAGESTPSLSSATIAPTPTPPNATANIYGAQVNTTLTEVTIACTGQSCTYGIASNTTPTTIMPPLTAIAANISMIYTRQNPLLVGVQFTDSSVNTPPYSWMWSWKPSANLSSESDPSIVLVFSQYGTYQVTRTVSNTLGTSSSSTDISVCPLVASFTTNQTSGPVPLTVRFADTSTDQPVSWSWNFGDGSTSTLQNPVHTYTTSGTYTVRLDATNSLGSCWNTTGISVSSLSASFSANQTSGLAPLAVQFTDSSTDQPTKWSWDFGDGSISSLQNPAHTYTSAGVYTVNLKATNGFDGWISATPDTITAYSLPTVDFKASPLTGPSGTSVLFNDQSTGFPAPTSFYWDFGDGFTSTYQNPSHQYASSGAYTISHSATNSQGTVWLNRTGYISIS